LQSKNLGVELLIWWVWEELDDMKAKNWKLKWIKFLWLLDDVSIIENLQKSLIFLFPSKIDSFGITILEAGYLWVPTIAFALNWAYELVDNWQSWFLVNSSDEFNKKTYELLTYYMLCKSFSKKAREKSVSFNKLRFRRELSEIFKVNKKWELS
jgi:glycosyltransferase involved in cell wall biosynthesis